MIAAGLSLATFWAGVTVGAVFLIGHLFGWEWEIRQYLRECERVEQARALERKRAAADLERVRAQALERARLRARLERERGRS